MAVMAKPVILVVDDEDASLKALAGELDYGRAHHRGCAVRGAGEALARLNEFQAERAVCCWSWLIGGCQAERARGSSRR